MSFDRHIDFCGVVSVATARSAAQIPGLSAGAPEDGIPILEYAKAIAHCKHRAAWLAKAKSLGINARFVDDFSQASLACIVVLILGFCSGVEGDGPLRFDGTMPAEFWDPMYSHAGA
jgi:hypothetical protein